MKLSKLALGILCLAALVWTSVPLAAQDEDVRGAFLTSRPKEKSPAAQGPIPKQSRRRPKPTPSSNTTKVQPVNPDKPNTSTPKNSTEPKTPVNTARLGLGVTLFMRDANGLAIRTDPSHVFRKGDRVRIVLETNSDGYLYIFNTTNDGPATMIYPDPQLDEAGNYLQAHVPFEIPNSAAAFEQMRWFAFDNLAGDEKLYFVFTREPINGIPLEDDLIAFCRDSASACPMKPTADLWAQLQSDMKTPLATDRTAEYGNAETLAEQKAASRGVGLAKDDPQPSVIMMATAKSSRLVTSLSLIHK